MGNVHFQQLIIKHRLFINKSDQYQQATKTLTKKLEGKATVTFHDLQLETPTIAQLHYTKLLVNAHNLRKLLTDTIIIVVVIISSSCDS